jgi:hypothetical protein
VDEPDGRQVVGLEMIVVLMHGFHRCWDAALGMARRRRSQTPRARRSRPAVARGRHRTAAQVRLAGFRGRGGAGRE